MRDYATAVGMGMAKLSRVYQHIRQAMCYHDFQRHNVGKRMALKCGKCYWVTPGIDMTDAPRPKVIYEKADERYSAGPTK